VDYGFEDGQWTDLENGDRIWRMLISSPGALSLNFIFDDFYMPQGASMYIYNHDQSDLIGCIYSLFKIKKAVCLELGLSRVKKYGLNTMNL
jgi:hypothetical protein